MVERNPLQGLMPPMRDKDELLIFFFVIDLWVCPLPHFFGAAGVETG